MRICRCESDEKVFLNDLVVETFFTKHLNALERRFTDKLEIIMSALEDVKTAAGRILQENADMKAVVATVLVDFAAIRQQVRDLAANIAAGGNNDVALSNIAAQLNSAADDGDALEKQLQDGTKPDEPTEAGPITPPAPSNPVDAPLPDGVTQGTTGPAGSGAQIDDGSSNNGAGLVTTDTNGQPVVFTPPTSGDQSTTPGAIPADDPTAPVQAGDKSDPDLPLDRGPPIPGTANVNPITGETVTASPVEPGTVPDEKVQDDTKPAA